MVGVTGVVAILVWSTSVDQLAVHPERWGWVADAFLDDVQPATKNEAVKVEWTVGGKRMIRIGVKDDGATGRP